MKLEAIMDGLALALSDQYDYSFDHVAQVEQKGELAVRWVRLSPSIAARTHGNGPPVNPRFRFQLSAIPAKVYELYDFASSFGLALSDHFTIESVGDDANQDRRVQVNIDARLDQKLTGFRKEA